MPFVEEGKRNVLWRRRYSIRHWPSVLSSYKRGDPAPPNAVIVETSDTEGLLLLGSFVTLPLIQDLKVRMVKYLF